MRILYTLPSKFVLNVATLGPLGRTKFIPGTVGSLAGVVWYITGFWNTTFFQFATIFLFSIFLGSLFCGEAEIRLQQRDPSCVILDEFCAMPICFWNIEKFTPQIPMWKIIVLGFLLFRFFDIVKPFGIRSIEKMSGGIGIMMDDIAAAFLTCLSVHIIVPMLFV